MPVDPPSFAARALTAVSLLVVFYSQAATKSRRGAQINGGRFRTRVVRNSAKNIARRSGKDRSKNAPRV